MFISMQIETLIFIKIKILQDIIGTATRMIIHGNYYRGLAAIFKNSRGGKKAIYRLAGDIIRIEVRDFANVYSALQEECTMDTIEKLSWEDIFIQVKQRAPMLYNAMHYALTSRKSEKDMEW